MVLRAGAWGRKYLWFFRGLQDRCAGITVLQFNTYWAYRCASDMVYH